MRGLAFIAKKNLLYDLEGQGESLSPPETPQIYDNYPASLSDATFFTAPVVPLSDRPTDIQVLQTQIADIRRDLSTIRQNFLGFMDVSMEQFDQLFQHLYSKRHFG